MCWGTTPVLDLFHTTEPDLSVFTCSRLDYLTDVLQNESNDISEHTSENSEQLYPLFYFIFLSALGSASCSVSLIISSLSAG